MRSKVTVRRVAPTAVQVLTDFSAVSDADLRYAQATMQVRKQGYWDLPAGRVTLVGTMNELRDRRESLVTSHGPLAKTGEQMHFGYWPETTVGTEHPLGNLDDRPVVTCVFCGDEITDAADHRLVEFARNNRTGAVRPTRGHADGDAHRGCSPGDLFLGRVAKSDPPLTCVVCGEKITADHRMVAAGDAHGACLAGKS